MTETQNVQTAKPSDRKTLRRNYKKNLLTKIKADKEFAKTYFEAKSKRSTEKKAAFQKKKSRKKA